MQVPRIIRTACFLLARYFLLDRPESSFQSLRDDYVSHASSSEVHSIRKAGVDYRPTHSMTAPLKAVRSHVYNDLDTYD